MDTEYGTPPTDTGDADEAWQQSYVTSDDGSADWYAATAAEDLSDAEYYHAEGSDQAEATALDQAETAAGEAGEYNADADTHQDMADADAAADAPADDAPAGEDSAQEFADYAGS